VKVLALVLGILGGLCAIMGIVTALAVIAEVMALTWMFWMVLAAILILGCIAANTGRSEYE
jgi:hypothetical protein